MYYKAMSRSTHPPCRKRLGSYRVQYRDDYASWFRWGYKREGVRSVAQELVSSATGKLGLVIGTLKQK